VPGPFSLRTARPRLAVTGGAAEGKSTVVRELERLGLRSVSADDVARQVMSDPDVEAKVAQECGLTRPLDPHALRERIARDPLARRAVNRAVHAETARRLIEADADVAEVPLLVEACLHWAFRRVWTVTCGPQEQRRRLIERLGDQDLADRLVASQLSAPTKIVFGDAVLRTDRALSAVHEDVRRLAEAHGLVSGGD
jgi:dephospho-CoA kinase